MDEQKKRAVAGGSNYSSDGYRPTGEFKKYCKENGTDYERKA